MNRPAAEREEIDRAIGISRRPASGFLRRWQTLWWLSGGIGAYVASAGWPERSVGHGMTTSLGIGLVLFGLAPPLAEISGKLEEWVGNLGMVALGAAIGFFIRTFSG